MIVSYRKNPLPIQALQFTGTPENIELLQAFAGHSFVPATEEGRSSGIIKSQARITSQADLYVGDYVIKGIIGEFYPVSAEVFEATYTVEPKEEDLPFNQNTNLSFSEAKRATKAGHRIWRKGLDCQYLTEWKGDNTNENQFAFTVIGETAPDGLVWVASQEDVTANDWSII